MNSDEEALATRIAQVQARIRRAAKAAGRAPETVQLLAVSKAQPALALRAACRLNLLHFGENYLQEALEKMEALADLPLRWHFIGTIQSNKTRAIASRFDWVHSVDRPRIAQRLSDGRPAELPPLSVCLQLQLGNEPWKSGAAPEALAELAAETALLPRLRLRGLMALPPPAAEPDAMAKHFRRAAECFAALRREHPQMDTLSMGMSADLESAVREGATLLRIGTGIFGPRSGRQL